jgi:hypothetical protein
MNVGAAWVMHWASRFKVIKPALLAYDRVSDWHFTGSCLIQSESKIGSRSAPRLVVILALLVLLWAMC